MKSKLIPIFIFVGVVILAILTYHFNQTVYNDDNTLGNTSTNLLNGGLYCEYEDKIYFSNPSDEGRLYVMNSDLSNPKRLSEDTAYSINVAGKYIIYGRHNENQDKNNENFFSVNKTGLYRMDKNGKNTKTLFDSVVSTVNLFGNTVYYQRNTRTGIGVDAINIDKSNETAVIDEPIFPFAISEGYLYYTGVKKNHNIFRMDLDTNASEILCEGNFSDLTLCGSYLYFLDLANNQALSKMKLDGTEQTTLVTYNTSTYNITSDEVYLYFQIDNDEQMENGIYRLDLTNSQITCIKEGDFCNIHCTSNYTFFQEFGSTTTFVVENIENPTVEEFNPSIE